MKLKQLKLTNFMPFKNLHQIQFPQDPNQNVMVIYGDNMRGKTSILNALRWCLYGKALDRYAREIPLKKLINSDAADANEYSMSVHLQFEHNQLDYDNIM